MKTHNLPKEKLEEFVTVFGKAIYLTKGWDQPKVVLLDSVGDCEVFYLKLINPKMMVNKLLETETINSLAANFWALNGYKYNWDFCLNKAIYTLDILVTPKSLPFKAQYLYEESNLKGENLSKLCDIVMVELLENDELYTEILSLLSLPKNFPSYYLNIIIKAILADELLDYCCFSHLCLFCRLPIFAYDSEDRLHNSSGPAIKFPNGECYYGWHGREVSKKWIVSADEVTREDLLAITNLEYRRILHEILGDERFARLLDLKVTEISTYNGQAIYLMCTSSLDRTIQDFLYFIKVICNSTGRQYHICISEEAYSLGAIGALAWTFGMEANEYQLLVET